MLNPKDNLFTPKYPEKRILYGLFVQGRTTFEEIKLFRLDGGNDAVSTIKILPESGHFFLIKRNLRKESRDYWLDTAKAEGEVISNNDRRTNYFS